MIIVTGGAGFIGSHLIESLLDAGHEVRVVDNKISGDWVSPKAPIIHDDICTLKPSHLKGAEAVFHMAADPDVRSSVSHPKKSFNINIVGTFNVLEACRTAGVNSFIFASSGGTVYGDTSEAVSESAPLRPISPYGASKAAFEMYLSAYAEAYGMNTPALRLGNVIGPRSRHGVIWDFVHKLLQNPRELEILGNGKQRKSYIYVSDVITAFMAAWKSTKGFAPYNVANDGTLSVTEIAELVSETMNLSPKFSYTGGERGWTGDVKKSVMSMDKIKYLGWEPKVSQNEAVRKYVEYLKEHHI